MIISSIFQDLLIFVANRSAVAKNAQFSRSVKPPRTKNALKSEFFALGSLNFGILTQIGYSFSYKTNGPNLKFWVPKRVELSRTDPSILTKYNDLVLENTL